LVEGSAWKYEKGGRVLWRRNPMGSRRPDAVTGMAVDRRVGHTAAGDPWLV
jgi:hypothetical protein